MKLLVASEKGDGLGLALHLSSEGHAVNYVSTVGAGTGLFSRNGLDDISDIYVFDSPVYRQDADILRQRGSRVLGTSRWSDTIDTDNDYTHAIIRAAGWPVTESCKGINLYITAWFNGRTFIGVYASLVYRRFMSEGKGLDIGFTGAISSFWQPTSVVNDQILKPLSRILSKTNHRGCIHIHTLIAEDGFYVKGLDTSFVHPMAFLFYENSRASTSDIMLRLFNEDSQPVKSIEHWVSCIMLSIPPYPYPNGTHSHRVAINGIKPANLKHLWLIDVEKDKDDWISNSMYGKLGYVTARGESVSVACRRAYRTIDNLDIPDLQYRTDIGHNVQNLLDTLRLSGWIR